MADQDKPIPVEKLFLPPETPLQAGQEFVGMHYGEKPAIAIGRYRIIRIEEEKVVAVFPTLLSIGEHKDGVIQVQVADYPGEKTFYYFSANDWDVIHHRLHTKGEAAEAQLMDGRLFQPILMQLLDNMLPSLLGKQK